MTSPFKSDVLSGRVALVTGGASGIGYEIARQLGVHGAKVVLMGRRLQPLEDAVKTLAGEGVAAAFVRGDVRNEEEVKNAVEGAVQKFGKLDILVNNAAGNFLSTAEDLRPKGFRTVMDIDAVGVFNASHAAFPYLKQSGDACIINITATLHYGATWYQIHPSAAKAAIDSMTRSMALEWGSYGIRCVGIAPGPIAGTAGITKLAPGVDVDAMASKFIPLGRLGTKFDIAMAAVFFCSSGGAFVSGDVLVVDGAAWMYKDPPLPREAVKNASRSVERKSRAVGIAGQSKM